MIRRLLPLGLALASLAAHALDVHVMQPWSRATPPGATVGVGYLTLHNASSRPQKLVGASSPRARAVQIHETRVVDGVSSMRPVAEVLVPAGGMVKLEPNGRHLMLVGLESPLKAGERVPLSLRFEGETAPVETELEVRPLGATDAPAAPIHQHH